MISYKMYGACTSNTTWTPPSDAIGALGSLFGFTSWSFRGIAFGITLGGACGVFPMVVFPMVVRHRHDYPQRAHHVIS